MTLCLGAPSFAAGADARPIAAHLSDQAFALLDTVNSDPAKAGPLLAPAAALAGDAQELSAALAGGDGAAAAHAMAAVLGDRNKLGAALATHPGVVTSSQVKPLMDDIDALANMVKVKRVDVKMAKPSAASAGALPAPASATTPAVSAISPVVPPVVSRTPPAGGGAVEGTSGGPTIKIATRQVEGDLIHITGYFEGENLRSAGIYAGARKLEGLNVGDVMGKEKVSFDLRERIVPGEELRVYDAAGRSAGERFVSVNARVPPSETGIRGFTPPPLGEPAAAAPPPRASGSNTEVIPSRSPSRKGIAKNGGGLGARGLTGIQINVIAVTPSGAIANGYQVIGQIEGGGIRRAGIYVDGRMVKPIPLDSGGAGYADFDVIFPMVGRQASIRVYGTGNNYAETSIDLSDELPGYSHLFPPGSPFARLPNRANPYAPPYGAPNGYPYGASPYRNPYPYANPYATPVPFWRRLLPF